MRFLRVLGIFAFVVAMFSIAVAKENKMGIHEVSNVTFDSPVCRPASMWSATRWKAKRM